MIKNRVAAIVKYSLLFISLSFAFDPVLAASGYSNLRPSAKFKVVTESPELKGFARSLAHYVNAGYADYVVDKIDSAQVRARVEAKMDSVYPTSSLDLHVRQSRAETVKIIGVQLASQYERMLSSYGEWRYLHTRKYKGRTFLLYGLTLGESSDYLEVEVDLSSADTKIVDWYMYGTEVWLTDIFGETAGLVLKASVEKDSSALAGLAMVGKGYQQVLAIYDALPETLRRNPLYRSIFVKSAITTNVDAFPEVMQRVLPYVQSDELIWLRLSYHFILDDRDNSLKYLQKMSAIIGGDYELAALEASNYLARGDFRKFQRTLVDAVKRYGDDEMVYYAALTLLVAANKMAEATEVLSVLDRDFNRELARDALAAQPELAALVDSPAYREWLESRNGS